MTTIKQYIKRSAFLLIPAMTLFGSCGKDFLNYPPELELPEAESMTSETRIEAQVTGLYNSLKNGSFYAGRYQIYNDIRGEEFLNRTGNVVTGFSTYQFSNDPGDSYIASFWSQGYLTINRANKFLADIESVGEDIISAEVKANFIAEAKFVRALTYYALIQLFAKPYTLDNGASRGIPLRLLPETTNENNNLAPSSVGDIYTQILKDLNEAEADIDETRSSDFNINRAHKNSVIALKTRIYLAQGNYASVVTEGDKLVPQSAPYIAPSGVDNQLVAVEDLFPSSKTKENILSWPYETNNAPGTQNQLGYYYNIGNIEYYLNPETPGIFASEKWPVSDARKALYTGQYDDYNILTKWGGTPYLDWVPVIRYAEVMLNLAEANAEVGNAARATALLEAVRHRSDADYEFDDLSSKENLVEAILLERRIELLGEGFRAPDLQRRNTPLPAIGLGSPVAASEDRYVFPIPTNEAVTNPGVTQ